MAAYWKKLESHMTLEGGLGAPTTEFESPDTTLG